MSSWFFASLRGYRIAWLPRDLVAGLMLLAIALPGQLATARLAGMPPETGIYAFVAGSLAFAAFGANRFMSVAADSTIAPIFAGGLAAIVGARSASYPELATLLALLVGVVLVVVGLLRAGWLATLLSIPITTGFLAGISVHIIVGELPTLLGVPNEQGHVLVRLVHTFGQVGHTNPYPLGLGAGVLIVTIGAARISSRVPGALIGLVGAGLAVAFFHLGTRGVSLLGTLSVRLPGLALPALPGMGELGRTIQLALVVAMGLHHANLGGGEHIPVRRREARRYKPQLRGGRFRQYPSRRNRRLCRRREPSQHRHRQRIRWALPVRFADGRCLDGRSRGTGSGSHRLCAPRGPLRGSGLYRIAHFPARRDGPDLSPQQVRNSIGGGQCRAGHCPPYRDRHAARHRAVVRAQLLHHRPTLLRRAGEGAGEHRVVAADCEQQGRA